MSSVNDIRSAFIDFFAKEGHEPVASSSLVPRNDPTLLFTNAGMVQFKNIFTGMEKAPYARAVTSQKCVRAGGKHNDLENVGYTARHHTFFEMLGNFSFGDYFKENAIDLAWRLVTKTYGLPKEKLLVTVYKDDDDAFNLWKKIAGLSDDRIIRISTADNFWSMGDTGPCGPCSEIFFDHGEGIPGGPPGSPDEDGDRFIEIWNLVFMQYEQRSAQERVNLPRPSIDTGMGLERVSAVLQGVHNNYDIDLFQALIRASVDVTGVAAEGAALASHRVIADHLRASSFLVADGVLPSNEGRGYVLRRIMRRAMRHAQLLGAQEPVMWKLLPALVREMGAAYPELVRAEALISETLRLEEGRFRKTLVRGMQLLDEATETLGHGQTLAGDVAFKLYDTYGFPLDLTQDALRPRGIHVDTQGFDAAMKKQKAEARAAWSGSGEAASETVWFGVRERVGATEFLGYTSLALAGEVTALVKDGVEVNSLSAGETGFLVTNQTPFYAESGGQVGDTGKGFNGQVRFTVTDTVKKLGDVFAHAVQVEEGSLSLGQAVDLVVDASRRQKIQAHHSATHLLHEALRQVLGDHVAQKGSLVSSERLRFDISHQKPMTTDELLVIENLTNGHVLANTAVATKLMPVDDAVASGARALFGEKYGDEVRVVSMGTETQGERTGQAFSIELCGGTHVGRTGEIGLVSIIGESAVSSGVRRVEALVGDAAREHLSNRNRQLESIAAHLRTGVADVEKRVLALVEERKQLEKELNDARRKLAMGGGNASDGAGDAVKTVNGTAFFARLVDGLEIKELKSLVDDAKKQINSGVAVIVGISPEGKAGVVVGVTADLTDRFNAVELVRVASEALGGKGGGGRPDLAQAGGPDATQGQAALQAVEKALSA